jgi:ectoine hydroxylase-related dioxygenase (phytanoyl-CoA dioxygenase family)
VKTYGETRLRSFNEFHTIRALLTHGDGTFLKVATNDRLLASIENLIEGKFILNQQNGIINPPQESYNQAAWHRDLPYQHFTSSNPIAVNALFCIDDFTIANGGTFVLPASHKSKSFPSTDYIRRNAFQVEAKAGQYILLDCMLFHSGGVNGTDQERRAINNVYSVPYLKQQIKLPGNISRHGLSLDVIDLLGYNYQEPKSIKQYLDTRCSKD